MPAPPPQNKRFNSNKKRVQGLQDTRGAKSATAREAAVRILMRVESSDSRARELLDESLRLNQFRPEDAGMLTDMVYGILRRRGTLDYYLGKIATRPLSDMAPWVRNLLRVALYQVLYFERVPNAAAVDTAVELTKKFGHEGLVKFVNGVLREFCRQKEDDKIPALPDDPVQALAVEYSSPLWLCAELVERYGFESAREFLDASNQTPPLTLSVNLSKLSRDEYLNKLSQSGHQAEACHFSPLGIRVSSGGDIRQFPGFDEGHFIVQDESSQMVAVLMGAQLGWKVADVCAAPGGKTVQLAQAVGAEGAVYAFDRKPAGVDRLQGTMKRLGLNQVIAEVQDALNPRTELLGQLDAVLVDAPCSGLGVLRRRVESRWQIQPDSFARQASLQIKILDQAAKYLKPGGVLLYTTCTIEERENEEVVQAFLEAHPDFKFDRAAAHLPAELVTREGFYRAWPGQEQMDGFFGARMVKNLT